MSNHFIRLITLTLICVSTVVAQRQSSSLKPSPPKSVRVTPIAAGWRIFTAPDNDFVVQFPAEPQRDTEIKTPSETMRRYSSVGGTILFQLMFFDTEFDPTSRDGNQLPVNFRQDMLDQAQQEGWTITRSQLLRKNVYEQERWAPMDKNPNQKLHVVTRHIRRYGRQYILACSSLIPDKTLDSIICHRFIDSFHSIEAPQPK